jgi:uncharacterized protein
LIRLVCEYAIEYYKLGKMTKLPQFGIVTNGTMLNRKTMDLLREFGIRTTVSMDGPERIHDALKGNGSFRKADQFVRKCLDMGLKPRIECTWTPQHYRHGITVVDLINFFYEFLWWI